MSRPSEYPGPQILDAQRAHEGRLRALGATGLLDAPVEEAFERLTRLAARLTGAPVAFLSLVDENRDFYLAEHGFAAPLCTTRELQGRTFCHYGLVSDGPVVLHDTLADPTLAGVPTVTSLGVRAYAGVPLRTREGHALGSFCAIDFEPRRWSDLDVEVLTELAQSALREIELRSALAAAVQAEVVARALARDRERMLVLVAHDLRSPLTVITACAELLKDEIRTEQGRTDLASLEAGTRSVRAMVDEIVEAASLGSGTLVLRRAPIGVDTLLADTSDLMRVVAERRGIVLSTRSVGEPTTISVDYQRMLRVFANLVGNAIHHTPAGTTVEVVASRAGERVRFEVADQGPGLPPEVLDHIFEPWWRGPTRARGGAGLGLSIVRSLVEAHGGQVDVSSGPAGSRFGFEIPIDRATA